MGNERNCPASFTNWYGVDFWDNLVHEPGFAMLTPLQRYLS
jgi:hypothetical protein